MGGFLAIPTYGMIEALSQGQSNVAVASACFVIGLLAWYVYWERNGKLHWVEISSNGLRYKQGRKIITIQPNESVRLERPSFRDAPVWDHDGVDFVSPHGRLRIDDSLEDASLLLRLICEEWKLDPLKDDA